MKNLSFSFSSASQTDDTWIVPVDKQGNIAAGTTGLSNQADLANLLQELTESGDLHGALGKTLTLIKPQGIKVSRLILIGLGELDKLTVKNYLTAIKAAAEAIKQNGSEQIDNFMAQIHPQGFDNSWSTLQNTLIIQQSLYQYSHASRGKFEPLESKLQQVNFVGCDEANAAQQAQATAQGMTLTKDLANMPSNFCTPTYLAETAEQLAKDYGFDVNILEREQMIEMGMGSFMAVAQGTPTPPKMICLSYQGANAEQAPIALVGKGVTFDTGGISLKPGASMDEMKYDMGGAATVLGVFKALGELKPAINVVAVIPSTENMPAGNAIKPGDVVTSLSGQTIEILNTDAEGRLILCDALTYVQQTYKPAKVIDMATLTGACIIALGNHVSAVLGNNQELVDELIASGQYTYDRLWQLPLGEEWDEQLKSNFADMANIGGREGGTITAAQFLARYTKEVDWAHLDIAGTAWTSGANKGASGRPVPTLVQFLVNSANA